MGGNDMNFLARKKSFTNLNFQFYKIVINVIPQDEY